MMRVRALIVSDAVSAGATPILEWFENGVTDAAMKMLATGKLPLSEIAFRSGFSSQASFTRAFRCATNMTPEGFRQHGR